MEFLFLTQDIYLEILILIGLILVLLGIWGHDCYVWISRIIAAIKVNRQIPAALEPISTPVPKLEDTPIDEKILEIDTDESEGANETDQIANEEIDNEKIDLIESSVSEKVDTSHVEKLTNIASSVRTLIARGMNHEAQALIVEGLSIEKDHRDLNLLLGQIYEQEGQYEKAEYIYKDMAELHSNDIEILEKLANVLIIEKKYIIANEIYKKIHASTGNTETTLYMLTHISHTLEDHHNTLLYAKQYVLQWPKNPEIISILATVQVTVGNRKDAIETYKNLKNLTPYSTEISEIIQKLLIEEELANNFHAEEV